MKARNLLVLLVVAALLGAWAYWSAWNESRNVVSKMASRVFPGLPLNAVAKVNIASAETNVVLARVGDVWTVASRFNYPARFDKIADTLRELAALNVGEFVAVSEARLGDFKLLSPVNIASGQVSQAGTLIELKDEQDRPLASVLIGKNFMRRAGSQGGGIEGISEYPDGQYLRTADGRVILVGKNLDRLSESVKTWLDDEFINVPLAEIQEVAVTGPERTPLKVVRTETAGVLALADLPADQEADSSKLNQIAGALNYLGFDDIAAPELIPKDTGLDRPLVFRAQTKNGRGITLNIGGTLAGDSFDRYVKVQLAYQPPAPESTNAVEKAEAQPDAAGKSPPTASKQPNPADETQALNDKLGRWVYILKSYRAEPMLIKREDLIKPKESPQTSATNAAETVQDDAGSLPPVMSNAPPPGKL